MSLTTKNTPSSCERENVCTTTVEQHCISLPHTIKPHAVHTFNPHTMKPHTVHAFKLHTMTPPHPYLQVPHPKAPYLETQGLGTHDGAVDEVQPQGICTVLVQDLVGILFGSKERNTEGQVCGGWVDGAGRVAGMVVSRVGRKCGVGKGHSEDVTRHVASMKQAKRHSKSISNKTASICSAQRAHQQYNKQAHISRAAPAVDSACKAHHLQTAGRGIHIATGQQRCAAVIKWDCRGNWRQPRGSRARRRAPPHPKVWGQYSAVHRRRVPPMTVL